MKYKIGIDVGGTNTDAVLIDENLNVVAEIKQTTSDDIYSGILSAIKTMLDTSGIDRKNIKQAMLGTTQCTNAIIERKKLEPIALLRIGSPAMGIPAMVDWADDLLFVAKKIAYIRGGFEHDGKEITEFDEKATREFFESVKGEVKTVAITCVFSTIRNDHEKRAAEICKEVMGEDIQISISSEIGSMGMIERENATILNAALYKVAQSFTGGFVKSLSDDGINDADIYISQNDGTLMTMENARKYPILTIACGPTNSIRGASYLSNLKNAIVVDVGGTTTDIGYIQNGFPRESSIAVTVGGVRTNFRMPDVISIGLGGGSIVREQKDGSIKIGPDSVGNKIAEKALIFGGDTLTTTDIAVRLGMYDLGDKSKVMHISDEFANAAIEEIAAMVEDSIDAMKVSSEDIDIILVGGGSIILPKTFKGAKSVTKPNYFGIANAIGSAISKVSGNYEQLINYDQTPREVALEQAKLEAIEMAVKAGAIRETVEIIDIEDVPLAYYAGNTNRVKIKSAGDLK